MLSCGHASLACPPPSCSSNTTPAVIHNPKHQHHRQQRQPCRMVSCSADASSTTSTSNTTPYSGASGSDMAVQQQQQEQEPQPSTSGRTAAASHAARSSDLVTFQEMQEIATARGMTLTLKTLGPFYRITCRDGSRGVGAAAVLAAGGEEGRVLGVTNGFVAPWFGLMHCDTLQIFTRGMKGQEGERVRKNALGLGLLLGGAVLSYGHSCGCTKAEILAINDDDAWHERLVRYYSYFGFKPVCKVGGQGFFKDTPHLLVWGGEGTRMDADIVGALQKWTPALRQSRRRKEPLQQDSSL